MGNKHSFKYNRINVLEYKSDEQEYKSDEQYYKSDEQELVNKVPDECNVINFIDYDNLSHDEKDLYLCKTKSMDLYEINRYEILNIPYKQDKNSKTKLYYKTDLEDFINRNPRPYSKKNTVCKSQAKRNYGLTDLQIEEIGYIKYNNKYIIEINNIRKFFQDKGTTIECVENKIKKEKEIIETQQKNIRNTRNIQKLKKENEKIKRQQRNINNDNNKLINYFNILI